MSVAVWPPTLEEDIVSENAQSNDRKPTPDRAEDNAFFPSPYSLSQYTAPKTDFDGIATKPGAYAGGRWKVLVIASEERYLLMHNETMFSTGNHPVETLLPLHHMLEAGFEVEVATLTGAPVKFEWWAFPTEDQAVGKTWRALRSKCKSPKKLAEVVTAELGEGSDYLAVFVPGGHGAMVGLRDSLDVQSVLDWALAEDKLIVSLCHGPAAFLAASLGRDASPFAGYSICAFPNAPDAGANVDIGYLPGPMPWLLGTALQADGITLANDEQMTGATTRDRNVLSGDSPLAANALGKMAATALVEKAA
jgi:molecular chaperone Hsp31 and glyoxalase 3